MPAFDRVIESHFVEEAKRDDLQLTKVKTDSESNKKDREAIEKTKIEKKLTNVAEKIDQLNRHANSNQVEQDQRLMDDLSEICWKRQDH